MALQIGVNYELFWSLNPKKIKPFVSAYERKLKYEYDIIDAQAWLYGYYSRLAIASSMSRKTKYPTVPNHVKAKEINEKLKDETDEFEGQPKEYVQALKWMTTINKTVPKQKTEDS